MPANNAMLCGRTTESCCGVVEYIIKDEAALYENNFQPYGTVFLMNADGSNKQQLTDSRWEDSMAKFVP